VGHISYRISCTCTTTKISGVKLYSMEFFLYEPCQRRTTNCNWTTSPTQRESVRAFRSVETAVLFLAVCGPKFTKLSTLGMTDCNIGIGAQSTLGGHDIFARKMCEKK